ncbi:MAG: hypothetical protein JOZ05_22160 [Acetobacteraceae bacterium]|nr:hypothetical protein [Acetobacteraceae bacterium]
MIGRFEPGIRDCLAVSYGGLLFVSGMLGWENQGGPVEAQVEEVLAHLDRALGLPVGMAAVAALGPPVPVSAQGAQQPE